jgi:hypothetical protein
MLTEMDRLLLMAAAVHGLGSSTDLRRANAAKVVGQALVWAGLVDDEVREAWRSLEGHPAIDQCYEALIRMIRRLDAAWANDPTQPLFEGMGNFGSREDPPAYPHFTSCRLTLGGEQLARELLEQHPEYRNGISRGSRL